VKRRGIFERFRGVFAGRGRAKRGTPAGGPPGAPGESGPGSRGYDGEVHLGEEGAAAGEEQSKRPA
jgi:hypothetical protein